VLADCACSPTALVGRQWARRLLRSAVALGRVGLLAIERLLQADAHTSAAFDPLLVLGLR
jgi:hypothetical protein